MSRRKSGSSKSVDEPSLMAAKEKWINGWCDELVTIVAAYNISKQEDDAGDDEASKSVDRLRSLFNQKARQMIWELVDLRIVERWPQGHDPAWLLDQLCAARNIMGRTT